MENLAFTDTWEPSAPEQPQRLPARRQRSEAQKPPAPRDGAGDERRATFQPRSAEDRAEDFLIDWVRRFSRA